MTIEKIVAEVNENLKVLHDEAIRGRENPILIGLIEQMVRLTNMDNEVSGKDEPKAADPEPEDESKKPADPETCKHQIISVFGKCQQCGTCLHTQQRDNICSTCGEAVPA